METLGFLNWVKLICMDILGQLQEADISTFLDEATLEKAENLALHELTHLRFMQICQTKGT